MSFLDNYRKVYKAKRKTTEEKEQTKYYQFAKQKDFESKKQEYNQARKKMGLGEDKTPTAEKYKRLIGDADRGDRGEYARWKEYNESRKTKVQSKVVKDKPKEKGLGKVWGAVKKVGKAIDKNVLAPVERFNAQMTNTATFGLGKFTERKLRESAEKKGKTSLQRDNFTDKDRGKIGKAADVVAQGVGYLAPGSLATKGAKALGLGAKITKGMSKTKKVLQMAKEGAVVGGAIGLAETPMKKIDDKETNKETLKRIALETGLGAVGDPLLHGVGKVASNYLKRAKAKKQTPLDKRYEFQKEKAKSVSNPINERYEKIKAEVGRPRGQKVDEILQAMEQEGFKTGKKNRQVNQAKLDDVQKSLDTAQMDALVRGYEEQKPKITNKSIEDFGQEVAQERERKQGIRKYQERYKELRDYVDKSYPNQVVNDDIIREAWSHIARRDEDFGVDELIDRAYPKGSDIDIDKVKLTRELPRVEEELAPKIDNRQLQIPDSPMNVADQSLNAIMKRMKKNREQGGVVPKGWENISNQRVLGGAKPVKKEKLYENISAAPQLERRLEPQLDPTTAPLHEVVNPDAKALPDDFDAMEHMKQQFVAPPKEVKAPLKERIQKGGRTLYKQWFDKRAALARMDKAAGRDLNKSDTAIARSHTSASSGAKTNQQLQDGYFDKHGNKTGESFVETFKDVKDLKDTMAYMGSKRLLDYEERSLQGIDAGEYAQKDIAERSIQQFEKAKPHVVNEAKKITKFMDNQLNILRDAEIFNDKNLAQMKEDNPNFLPFERDRSDIPESMIKQGGGGMNPSKPIMKRTGSTRKIIDPEKTIMKRQYMYNNVADRNKVNMAVLENINLLGKDNQFARVVGVDKDYAYKMPKEVDGEIVEQDMLSHLDDVAQESDESIDDTLDSMFVDASGDANRLYAYKDGDRYHIEILDPELAEALSTMNSETAGTFAKLMSAPTDMLRWGVTISPDFTIRNFLRDQVTTALASPVGYKPFADSIMGAHEVIKHKLGGKSPLVEAYIKNGGSMKVLGNIDQKEVQKGYDDLMKDRSAMGHLKEIAKNPLKIIPKGFQVLEQLGEVSEMSTRIGHMRRAMKTGDKRYKKALKKNLDPGDAEKLKYDIEDATYIARAALDFSRNGSLGKHVNKAVPFFNATLQGMDVLGRAMKDRPIQTAANIGKYVIAPSLAFHYMNRDEDWYKDIPREERDKNWYFKAQDSDMIFKIPKPFEPGILFGSGIERAWDKYEKDPDAYEGFGKSLFDTFTPPVLPQMIKPLLEVITNHNFYTGKGIEGMTDQYKEVPEKKTVYSSQLAQQLSKGLTKVFPNQTLSPKKIDHLIRGYGGTMTDVINRTVVDKGIETIAKDVPKRPSGDAADTAFLGSFLVKNLEGNNEPTNKFYDLQQTLQKMSKSVKEGETFKYEKERKAVNSEFYKINKLQSNKRDIQDDPKMSGEEKTKEIKKLNKQITDIARKGLQYRIDK